jgi:hypothetical protein
MRQLQMQKAQTPNEVSGRIENPHKRPLPRPFFCFRYIAPRLDIGKMRKL